MASDHSDEDRKQRPDAGPEHEDQREDGESGQSESHDTEDHGDSQPRDENGNVVDLDARRFADRREYGRKLLDLERFATARTIDETTISVKVPGEKYRYQEVDLREPPGSWPEELEQPDYTDEERVVVSKLLEAGGFALHDHVPKDTYSWGEEGEIAALVGRGYELRHRYPYYDAEGRLVFVQQRYEKPEDRLRPREERKLFRSVSWNGEEWRYSLGRKLKQNMSRPLYRLDHILRYKKLPVFLVEGEKVVEALRDDSHMWSQQSQINQQVVVTTGASSQGGLQRTDLSVLRGRRVYVIGDRDEAGVKFGESAVEHLHEQGVDDVHLYQWPFGTPDEVNDLADDLPDWFTADTILRNSYPRPRLFHRKCITKKGKNQKDEVEWDKPYFDATRSDAKVEHYPTRFFASRMYYSIAMQRFVFDWARHTDGFFRSGVWQKPSLGDFFVKNGYSNGPPVAEKLLELMPNYNLVQDFTTSPKFVSGRRDQSTFVRGGSRTYNFYTPVQIRPIQPNPDREALWLEHLNYLCNDDPSVVQHVIDFFHHTVFYPQHKINHMIVVVGTQGIGKSIMQRWFDELLSTAEVNASDAESDFNSDWAQNKLVFLAELGKIRGKMYDRIKSWVDQEEININHKSGIKYRATPMTNFVLTTNDDDFAHITPDDRKFFVVSCEQGKREQEYYERVGELGKYPAEFMGFLRKHHSGKFHHKNPPPMTEAKEELVANSADSYQTWFEMFLRSQWGHQTVGEVGVYDTNMIRAWVEKQVDIIKRVEKFGGNTETQLRRIVRDIAAKAAYQRDWHQEAKKKRLMKDHDVMPARPCWNRSKFETWEMARLEAQNMPPYQPRNMAPVLGDQDERGGYPDDGRFDDQRGSQGSGGGGTGGDYGGYGGLDDDIPF